MVFAGFIFTWVGCLRFGPLGAVAFGPRGPISGLVQPGGLRLSWRGTWLVAGRAGFWGALATWVGVGSSSPQVPGHPTSMCDAGVK